MRALITLSAALGLACSEPLGPASIAGRYALVDPITVTLPNDAVETVLTDTLVLESTGMGVRRARIQRPASPTGVRVDTLVIEFGYRVRDRSVGIAFGCPPMMLCAAIAVETWYDIFLDQLVQRDTNRRFAYRRVGGAG